MEFLIAGLLALDLAVTLVSGCLLKRETVEKLCDVKKRLDMVNRSLLGVNEAIENLGEASSRGDEEDRQSRAIEKGIANLLSYSVGKGREEPS